MSDESERLLYVLSAKGSVPWGAFKRVFDRLDSASAIHERGEVASRFRRNRTMRILEALGHCDFQFSGTDSRVCVAPPVCVRLPKVGLPMAILAGVRSPDTRPQIENSCAVNRCRLTVSPQNSDVCFVPTRFLIEAETEEALHELAHSLGVHFDSRPAAWLLASFAATLDKYLEHVPWRDDGELNWQRKEFSCDRIQFQSGRSGGHAPALIRYTNPKRSTVLHFFQRAGKYAEVDCDWGRYAILHETGLNMLVYDEKKQLFAVPRGAPLPRLFARSLGLCSGFAPVFLSKDEAGWASPESTGFEVFRAIPSSIAHLVAEKLGQSLVPLPVKLAGHSGL